MPPGDSKYNGDDYIAKLLSEDAKKSSQRYAAVGLSALLPKRPTNAAPKPNTRFLTHLVKEVDSHNAALKKKEELEAKIRLREMRDKRLDEKADRDYGRERKRRRVADESDEDRRNRQRRQRSRDRRRSASPRDSQRDRRRRRDDEQDSKSRRRKDERSHHSRSRRHRSRSSERDTTRHGHSRDKTKSSNHQHQHQSLHKSQPSKRRHSTSSHSSVSSDPLSHIIGPQSASPKARGRGAHRPAQTRSNIDAHFSATYDPAQDVQPASDVDSDGEDWDMALEALRDRATWKRKQADRLREAGFGDEEIRKWEGSAMKTSAVEGDEDGDVRHVKWKRKGEAREWDLGKKGFDGDSTKL